MLVIQLAEEVNFSQNPLSFSFLGPVGHLDLFDCVDVLVKDVPGLEHHAEGTFSNLTDLLEVGFVAVDEFLLRLNRDIGQGVFVFSFGLFTHRPLTVFLLLRHLQLRFLLRQGLCVAQLGGGGMYPLHRLLVLIGKTLGPFYFFFNFFSLRLAVL